MISCRFPLYCHRIGGVMNQFLSFFLEFLSDFSLETNMIASMMCNDKRLWIPKLIECTDLRAAVRIWLCIGKQLTKESEFFVCVV